jgi:hypothetical protein
MIHVANRAYARMMTLNTIEVVHVVSNVRQIANAGAVVQVHHITMFH